MDSQAERYHIQTLQQGCRFQQNQQQQLKSVVILACLAFDNSLCVPSFLPDPKGNASFRHAICALLVVHVGDSDDLCTTVEFDPDGEPEARGVDKSKDYCNRWSFGNHMIMP